MAGGNSSILSNSRRSTVACDAYRQRKVRCNGASQSPGSQCGNCRLAELSCRYELPRRKRGPKRRDEQDSSSQMDSHLDSHRESPVASGEAEGAATGVATDVSTTSTISFHPTLHSPVLQRPSPSQQAAYQTPCRQKTSHSPTPLDDIQKTLIAEIEALGASVCHVATQCIAVAAETLFPLSPFLRLRDLTASVPLLVQPLTIPTGSDDHHLLEEPRAFAFLAILCSAIFATYPAASAIIPGYDRVAVSRHFLGASRDTLAYFHDLDILHPTSSSLAIRLLLYTADKSASVLNNVPSVMHRLCFDPPLPVSEYRDDLDSTDILFTPSVTSTSPYNEDMGDEVEYEKQVYRGFFLINKLWEASADLIMDIKILARMSRASLTANPPTSPQSHNVPDPESDAALALVDSYVEFCGILDSLPPWLLDPDAHTTSRPRRAVFWIQRTNLLVTSHCLRLIVLQRAAEHGCCHVLGLPASDPMLAHRKVEIASDMALEAGRVPFEALQANCEHCVSVSSLSPLLFPGPLNCHPTKSRG